MTGIEVFANSDNKDQDKSNIVRSAVASEAFYPSLYQRLCDMIDSGADIYKGWEDAANGAINFIDWAISHGFDRNHRYLWRYNEMIEFCPDNCCWLTAEDFETRRKTKPSTPKEISTEDYVKLHNQAIDPNIGNITDV